MDTTTKYEMDSDMEHESDDGKSLLLLFNCQWNCECVNGINFYILLYILFLGLPNVKAWGKKKSAYFGTDYVDKDFRSKLILFCQLFK